MNKAPKITLLILNYNGKKFLKKCLQSALAACEFTGRQVVHLIDNSSSDGSVEFVQEMFPDVEIEVHPNRFLFSYNEAVRNAKTPYVFLLNNDVELKEDCIPPLLKHFEDPLVFAIQSKMITRDGEDVSGGGKRYFSTVPKRGFLTVYSRSKLKTAAPTACTSGGGSLIDRKKFIELGGFDPLFYPAYCEDLDLTYRAWKRGWYSLYEPHSIVYHEHHGTMRNYFSSERIRMLNERNRLLFTWKNIRSISFLSKHAIFLSLRLVKKKPKGFLHLSTYLLLALKKLPKIARRWKMETSSVLTNSQIWRLVDYDEVEAFRFKYKDFKNNR